MDVKSALAEAPLIQKVALLGIACEASDEGELRADEVCRCCNERFTDVAGRLTEGDVSKALNQLAETAVLEGQRPDDRSPVGKGRPSYRLATDPSTVLDALAEDDRLGDAVESARADLE